MKQFLIFTVIIFSLFNTQGVCSSKDHMKLAIIDRDKILSESLAFQDIKRQIEIEQSNLQKDSFKQEEELRQAEQALSKQQGILSEEVFNQKVQDFNNSVQNVQQDISIKNIKLKESYVAGVKEIFNSIKNIASSIAKEENMSLILFISKEEQVFYSTDEIDISDKVIKILNKKVPNFDIKTIDKL